MTEVDKGWLSNVPLTPHETLQQHKRAVTIANPKNPKIKSKNDDNLTYSVHHRHYQDC